YYDFVGGIPGGKQRQANLRALYDRARQYEETSFRGLFRFLRFIERMQDRGDDLGAARALGEQEDVIRLMTIHKSKGLEFPIVFVAGLGKQFNMQDLRAKVMLHKDLGFASKFVHPKLRVSYPTIAQHAMKRRMQFEMIAEEMRVLYVALTRAKEKLILTATVKDAAKKLQSWKDSLEEQEWLLPAFKRANAVSYTDWIGPALIRHHQVEKHIGETVINQSPYDLKQYPAEFSVQLSSSVGLEEEASAHIEKQEELLKSVESWEPINSKSELVDTVEQRLNWSYPYRDAVEKRAKQSVTEIKRTQQQDEYTDNQYVRQFRGPIQSRPRFMQKEKLTAPERGTAMHMVMQHVELREKIDIDTIATKVDEMVAKELLTAEQANAIDVKQIVAFYETDLGQRVIESESVKREVPFTMTLRSNEAYPNWLGEGESVLVQGVIDCVIKDSESLVLIDYKTDAIQERFKGGFVEAKPKLVSRYKIQIDMYTKALEQIWKRPVTERYLYFFDGGHVLKL
ncbi:3'-5' exonuclease, partial [Bacillus solimangrovi]|uniref:3'-5' exonuclease n=1 Tax=Bacillus solimangrovi TaxID=1305675 RepID=UPI000A5A2BE7